MRCSMDCSHPSLLAPRARSQEWEARAVLTDSRGIISGCAWTAQPQQRGDCCQTPHTGL